MTTEERLTTEFLARLPDKQLGNLYHHYEVGTGILCGERANETVDPCGAG